MSAAVPSPDCLLLDLAFIETEAKPGENEAAMPQVLTHTAEV